MKAFFRSFRGRLLLLSMVLSALFLGICSKSSPLYPLNDWVDVHCFFTMGRGILEGIVPYRDLYEQKGPVLYFLFALAALVSDRSFWGVFLMEVATYGLFLYFSGRIMAIYLGEKPIVYFLTAILCAVIPVSKAFAHGGGAEQLCLFMLAYSLWSVLSALQDKRPLSFWEAFLNGVFAAAVLYIKFTMLGFYIGLALFGFSFDGGDSFLDDGLFRLDGIQGSIIARRFDLFTDLGPSFLDALHVKSHDFFSGHVFNPP